MATVSKSFTAVGVSDTLSVRGRQNVTFSLSGTYAGQFVVEKAKAPSELAWERVTPVYSTANATVSVLVPAEDMDRFRVRCLAYTSGTAVTSIADEDEVQKSFFDAVGSLWAELKETVLNIKRSVSIDQDLTVSGTATLQGIPSAELSAVDPSQKATYFTDFFGDTLDALLQGTAGSGTGNAVAIGSGVGGTMTITTASDDGAITANASALAVGALNCKANQGGLVMEARLKISDVSEAYLFLGFTDVLPGTTLEAPIFLVAADIDSDASDACGILYDVDGTTKQWAHGGVKANTDTTPAYSGTAPADDTYVTLRVEVSSAGAVTGYVNGTAIGTAVANAVTATTALCPAIVAANRSANPVVVTVDYLWVQQNR